MKLKPIHFIVAALVIVFFSAAMPQIARADLIPGPWDIADSILGAVEEFVSPIVQLVIQVTGFYIVSLISLYISTSILQWEINNPGWINLRGTVVTVGWDICQGLANMFLLLIFVFIAFGFILKIEKFQSKKSLPRLIIVALLINFSRLFCGMIVDIGTIFHNTIIQGQQDLITTAMKGLFSGMYGMLTQLVTWLVSTFAIMKLPLASVVGQIAIVTSFVTKGFIVINSPVWIMQLLLAFVLTGIFALYIFLFAARVYIIEILTILSPIAFLCLILPQTQKYWSEWLQHLIQWTFLGVILLFFMMIGLTSAEFIMPSSITDPASGSTVLGNAVTEFLPVFFVPKYFSYYSFLFIYLAVVVWMVNRVMPMIAMALVGFASGAATQAYSKFGQPATEVAKGYLNRAAEEHSQRTKDIKDGKVRLDAFDTMKHQISGYALKPVFGAHRLLQTTPSQAVNSKVSREVKHFEDHFGKDKDGVDHAMSTVDTRLMAPDQKMAFMQFGMKYKGGKFVRELDGKGGLDDALKHAMVHQKGSVKEAIGYTPEKLDGPMGKQLTQTILSGEKGQKEITRMQKVYGGEVSTDEINKKAALSVASMEILGNKDKTKEWGTEALEHKGMQEAIVSNMQASHIQQLGETQGQAVVDKIHDKFEEMGLEKTIELNVKGVRSTVLNPGVREIFPTHEKIAYDTTDRRDIRSRGKDEQIEFINDRYAAMQGRQVGPRPTNQGPQGGGGGAGRSAGGAAGPGPGPAPAGNAGRGGGATPPGQTNTGVAAGGGRGGRQTNIGDFGGGRRNAGNTRTERGRNPGQTNLGNFGNVPPRQSPPDQAAGEGAAETTRRQTAAPRRDDIIPGADNAPPNRREY